MQLDTRARPKAHPRETGRWYQAVLAPGPAHPEFTCQVEPQGRALTDRRGQVTEQRPSLAEPASRWCIV
jgi:hypothetical protein